jgi:hypothetical protein
MRAYLSILIDSIQLHTGRDMGISRVIFKMEEVSQNNVLLAMQEPRADPRATQPTTRFGSSRPLETAQRRRSGVPLACRGALRIVIRPAAVWEATNLPASAICTNRAKSETKAEAVAATWRFPVLCLENSTQGSQGRRPTVASLSCFQSSTSRPLLSHFFLITLPATLTQYLRIHTRLRRLREYARQHS